MVPRKTTGIIEDNKTDLRQFCSENVPGIGKRSIHGYAGQRFYAKNQP